MASHVLALTNGTTTINLADLTNTLTTKYTPATAETDELAALKLGDGGELTRVDLRNVTETVELLLMATTKPNLQALINSIEAMLFTARWRQKEKVGPRVYLQLQVDGEAQTWRSEILSGRLALDEEALTLWPNVKAAARLHLTRRYYWEGAEVELQLSTSNQSAATGGRTIRNHDDSGTGDDNWVQIAADQVKGTLPTPVRLMLTNVSGAAQGYRDIYLAVNAFADPGNFVHMIEGESFSGLASSADVNSSNGAAGTLTWTGVATATVTIPASTVQAAAGRFFRLLARFNTAIGHFYVQPILRDANGLLDVYAVGDEVYVASDNRRLVDLGVVPLPPSKGENVSWAALTLMLRLRAPASSTIGLDFIQLTPLDSYCAITQRGYDIPANGVISIDGQNGVVHSGGYAIYTPVAFPLYLFPMRLQRILILENEGVTAPAIANSFSVRAYVRPRRLTV